MPCIGLIVFPFKGTFLPLKCLPDLENPTGVPASLPPARRGAIPGGYCLEEIPRPADDPFPRADRSVLPSYASGLQVSPPVPDGGVPDRAAHNGPLPYHKAPSGCRRSSPASISPVAGHGTGQSENRGFHGVHVFRLERGVARICPAGVEC